MNRSFVVLAGATFIALALLLSTQISAPASQKQPHRVAVQVNVNDPAVMNLTFNNVSYVDSALPRHR
jgi:hypothetical protein